MSSTNLHTGSGTASFLHAFGPVFLTVSDLIPPRVTASSLEEAAVVDVVETVPPNKLVAGAVAAVVLLNKLVPVLVAPIFSALPRGAGAREVFPKRDEVFVGLAVVVAGLDAPRLLNSPEGAVVTGRLMKEFFLRCK